MRALIQRVSQASVTVDGEVLGQIGPGLVVFVGISETDGQSEIEYIVSKTVNLRIFADAQGRFNLSALDVNAQLLVVSQFTLYGIHGGDGGRASAGPLRQPKPLAFLRTHL